MMKFTIDAKELKEMMEKGMTTINKKAAAPSLTKLYLGVDVNGNLKITGTDLEHYVEVITYNAFDTSAGVLGIDIDDIKVITKMTGLITFEDVSTETETKINIKCGKKTLSIPRYENTDIFLPSMDNTEKQILSLKENWLLESVVNLEVFTKTDEANKMLNVFNFNTKEKRIEALDGTMIGMRKIAKEMILAETENPFDTIKIHKMCVPVLKKILDKKSDEEVIVSQDKKYIKVKGNDFTYVIRRSDGEYYKTEQMLRFNEDYKITLDRGGFLDVMKYDAELSKVGKYEKQNPVVLYNKNGKLYSYIETCKYEAFDELDVRENSMQEGFFIGFNPNFLTKIFSIVDTDEVECIGTKSKAPMIVNGNEYSFLVLPVNLTGVDLERKIMRYIDKAA